MATRIFIEYDAFWIDAHSEAGHEILLKNLQNARNYAFEAAKQVEAATQALIDAGFEVPTW